MSEIRVDTISEKTSGSGTTVSNLKNPGSLGRNLIINGDMVISQRATGTTTISGNAHNTLDRFAGMESTDGTATLEQHSMSVADQATTGQRYAALWKCSGTDSSIGSAQYAGLSYFAEAQHLQHLLYGTSAAKDLTISFWVKSNTTGTYSLGIYKPDNTGLYHPTTYTISSANTWEKKSIHISPTAGSTSLITASGGAIANDNGLGIAFYFYTALGSTYHTSAINTWSTTADFGTSDQPNLMSSTDNNWYITGVQLEIGTTASDFEHVPLDVQLQRCLRYCNVINGVGGGNFGTIAPGYVTASTHGYFTVVHPLPMREAPWETTSADSDFVLADGSGSSIATTGIAVNQGGLDRTLLLATVSSGLTAGRGSAMLFNNKTTATITLDAEI